MALRIPGIIVNTVNDTGIVAPPIFERYPTIIGEGDPYTLYTNQAVVRSSSSTDPLPTTGTAHAIISIGDLPGIVTYTQGADYTLSGNNVDWIGGSGSIPTLGDTYYVTFTVARSADAYLPTLYFDENMIYADHGASTRTNGNVNDVTVGASMALAAGAGGVIVVQLDLHGAADPDSPTAQELENAFEASVTQLEQITDYKLFLVPMSSGTIYTTTAADIMFNHAVIASQPEKKMERTVIASLAKSTSYTTAATFAQSYSHERMVVPVISDATVSITGFTTTYDMRFYAATLAGKLCSVPIGRTISDEILPNLSFTTNYTNDELNYLVQRGVSPGKIRGTVVRNVLAITTDTTNALTEDLGVQDIKDYVKKYWREGLWNLYKNAPITVGLINQVRYSSVGMLAQLASDQIIADYRDITVTQDTLEPRKLLVTGKVKPAFSLQWMDVTFTFVLSFSS